MIVCDEDDCTAGCYAEGEPFAMTAHSIRGETSVWFQWYQCDEGHRYMLEVFEESPIYGVT